MSSDSSSVTRCGAGIVTLLPVLLGIAVCRSAHGNADDAQHLARQYLDAVSYNRHVAYQFQFKSSSVVNGIQNDMKQERSEGREVTDDGWLVVHGIVRRDGDRVDIIHLQKGATSLQAKDCAVHDARDVVSGGDWYHLAAGNVPADQPSKDASRRAGVVIKQMPRPGRDTRDLANEQASMEPGALMDGFVPWLCRSDKMLPNILLEANDLRIVRSEPLDGQATSVLRCSDSRFTYTAWLDPLLGGQARRIQIRSASDDSYAADMDMSHFSIVGPHHIADEGRMVMVYKRAGRTATETINYSRGSIDLAPDFARMGAFVMDAPPGYMLQNAAFPQIRWKLLDGKFVPLVDAAVTASVDRMLADAKAKGGLDASGAPSPPDGARYPWRWIASVSAGIVLVGTWFATRRHRGTIGRQP